MVIKEPSARLHNAITDIINHFGKLKEKVAIAITIGQEEGFTPITTGDLIRKELLAAGYHRSTVARMLPAEAKHMEKIREYNHELGRKMLPNDYQSNQLNHYNKQFLIEIIHYLEGKQTRNAYLDHPKTQSNGMKNKLHSDDKTQEILRLHKEGKSIRAIAAATSIPNTTVVRRLRQTN